MPSSEAHQRLTHYPLHAGYPLDTPQSYIPHDHLLSQHRPNNNRWEPFGELDPGQTPAQNNLTTTSDKLPIHKSRRNDPSVICEVMLDCHAHLNPDVTFNQLFNELEPSSKQHRDNRSCTGQGTRENDNMSRTIYPSCENPSTDLLIDWTNFTDNTSKED